MNYVWTFGDSFTELFKTQTGEILKYCEWKGYTPKNYGDFVAKELKVIHKCYGKGGTSNRTILSTLIKQIKNITEGDVIIVGWTNLSRHRVVDVNDDFFDLINASVHNENKIIENFSIDCTQYNFLMRESPIFFNELTEYMQLIKMALPKNKIYFWTWNHLNLPSFNPKQLHVINEYYSNLVHVGFIEDIITETNGQVHDYHYSENGHKILADKILEKINGE